MKDLTGQVAVVTGAGNGIGRGLAAEMRSRGAHVAMLDLSREALSTSEAALADEGRGLLRSYVVDVTEPQMLEQAASQILQEMGRIDIICANAGVMPRERPLWERSLEEWRWVFDVNVFAVVSTVQEFIRPMLEADSGHIVVTSSMQGVTTGRVGPYAASKHAAAAIAETLFADLQRAGSRVRVSCLLPSYTQNSLVDAPEGFVRYPGEQGDSRDEADLASIAQKLASRGKPARELGVLVADALGTDEFWLIPEPGSLARVGQRTHEIVETRRPSIATT